MVIFLFSGLWLSSALFIQNDTAGKNVPLILDETLYNFNCYKLNIITLYF